jgi:hypothetical protein
MVWIKNFFKISLYLSYLTITSLILLEVIFRFLPVSDSFGTTISNYDKPVMHFKKNFLVQRQTGFNFKHVVMKKTNNYGYFTDVKFEKNNKKNKIAIIGDSFVEASQVKNIDTFHGLLNSSTLEFSYYPIAVSGAPLSQYLLFAEFATKEFNPIGYIFTIIANDFDESWLKFKNTPGFQHFDLEGNLQIVGYSESKTKEILSKSALVRYLFLDLKIFYQFAEILNKKNYNYKIFAQNALNEKEIKVDKKIFSEKAVDIFFVELKKITKEKPVLFILDGDRDSIYEGKKKRNYEDFKQSAFQYFINNKKKYSNYFIIDLQNIFYENWIENNIRFDYFYDAHWNEHGHNIVFNSIQNSSFIKMLKK